MRVVLVRERTMVVGQFCPCLLYCGELQRPNICFPAAVVAFLVAVTLVLAFRTFFVGFHCGCLLLRAVFVHRTSMSVFVAAVTLFTVCLFEARHDV